MIGPRTFDFTTEHPEDLIYRIRFWSKVAVRADDECWDWTAGTHSFGYGLFGRTKASPLSKSIKTKIASRVAFILTNGPISDNLVVCHKCDRPLCCNPNHLFAASQKENLADMRAKGRWSPPPKNDFVPPAMAGERNANAKLKPENVAAILARRATGERLNSIAEDFNVSPSLISKIATGVSWKHIEGTTA